MKNLVTLCNIQAVLDAAILQNKPNGLSTDDQFVNTLTALDVELSEFANEGRWFKLWSENQNPRTHATEHDFFSDEVVREYNPLLEEFVDAVHFFLSLANQQGWQDALRFEERILGSMYDTGKGVQRFNENYLEMKHQLGAVFKRRNKLAFAAAWMNFLILGMSGFGFTWEQISEAYLAKNKINHERQHNGY